MFDPNSRYGSLATASYQTTDADGAVQVHVYKLRRFLPSPTSQVLLVEHTLGDSDRLDNLSASYTGDPTQFWRICDGNLILNPSELATPPGKRIRITMAKL